MHIYLAWECSEIIHYSKIVGRTEAYEDTTRLCTSRRTTTYCCESHMNLTALTLAPLDSFVTIYIVSESPTTWTMNATNLWRQPTFPNERVRDQMTTFAERPSHFCTDDVRNFFQVTSFRISGYVLRLQRNMLSPWHGTLPFKEFRCRTVVVAFQF